MLRFSNSKFSRSKEKKEVKDSGHNDSLRDYILWITKETDISSKIPINKENLLDGNVLIQLIIFFLNTRMIIDNDFILQSREAKMEDKIKIVVDFLGKYMKMDDINIYNEDDFLKDILKKIKILYEKFPSLKNTKKKLNTNNEERKNKEEIHKVKNLDKNCRIDNDSINIKSSINEKSLNKSNLLIGINTADSTKIGNNSKSKDKYIDEIIAINKKKLNHNLKNTSNKNQFKLEKEECQIYQSLQNDGMKIKKSVFDILSGIQYHNSLYINNEKFKKYQFYKPTSPILDVNFISSAKMKKFKFKINLENEKENIDERIKETNNCSNKSKSNSKNRLSSSIKKKLKSQNNNYGNLDINKVLNDKFDELGIEKSLILKITNFLNWFYSTNIFNDILNSESSVNIDKLIEISNNGIFICKLIRKIERNENCLKGIQQSASKMIINLNFKKICNFLLDIEKFQNKSLLIGLSIDNEEKILFLLILIFNYYCKTLEYEEKLSLVDYNLNKEKIMKLGNVNLDNLKKYQHYLIINNGNKFEKDNEYRIIKSNFNEKNVKKNEYDNIKNCNSIEFITKENKINKHDYLKPEDKTFQTKTNKLREKFKKDEEVKYCNTSTSYHTDKKSKINYQYYHILNNKKKEKNQSNLNFFKSLENFRSKSLDETNIDESFFIKHKKNELNRFYSTNLSESMSKNITKIEKLKKDIKAWLTNIGIKIANKIDFDKNCLHEFKDG